ncbi:FAD-binding domain-containing protein [Cyanobium sp. NIES-981]|uniref:FAD-binding domain-containing protein n=1 Tax=Cyanobium sp. NIES-981 TaxID=1851505 RepID=UPI0007DCDAB9|nr:FAD-binding domain-containing protein [Cyanobium sp. NIES-981]SBO43741.1 Deoxyribodipyrimidine photo-lyase [Cyanobium sp. NIES-981]
MSSARWLFWHRRDLRLADNLGLAAAAAATPAVTGVFVLDPGILEAADLAPARLWFLAASLRELAESWRAAGSRLLVLRGDPAVVLPQLAEALKAPVVAWNRDVEPYGRERDRRVAAALQADSRRVLVDWDQLLIAPEALRTGQGDPYRVYGPFWRNWRSQVEAKAGLGSASAGGLEPVAAPSGLMDLGEHELQALDQAGASPLPLVQPDPSTGLHRPHSFAGVDLCPCRPGEAAAQEQLQRFCDGGRLLAYEPGRNLPGEAGTSALSAALKFGTLSPRQAWAAAQQARALARSEEARQSITVWEQELAWREFYQQALFHFPELADGPYRPQWRRFPWENDEGRFEAWREGLTGVPIVDAAMRQLNTSGWMHNRCRMIVASFLVKDLICDWRWGERAFMARLVDGDLAANNGGWQWSASSGMDPKPLRIFNPATQAAKFDPEASYIRTWLPELRHVATADLISGAIPPLERRGYPGPIVEHRVQQARFKALYAGIRA